MWYFRGCDLQVTGCRFMPLSTQLLNLSPGYLGTLILYNLPDGLGRLAVLSQGLYTFRIR